MPKASWAWQDHTRTCPFHIPIEHGDRVLLIDPEHPEAPDELEHGMLRDLDNFKRGLHPDAHVEVEIVTGQDEWMDYFLQPGHPLKHETHLILKRPKGQRDVKAEPCEKSRATRKHEPA